MPKVILVANDIDITDIGQVVWAMATRYRPGENEHCFPQAPGIPMVPYLTSEEAAAGRGGKSVTSCLQPENFRGTARGTTASFRTSYPAELQQRVLANWAAYGLGSGSGGGAGVVGGSGSGGADAAEGRGGDRSRDIRPA